MLKQQRTQAELESRANLLTAMGQNPQIFWGKLIPILQDTHETNSRLQAATETRKAMQPKIDQLRQEIAAELTAQAKLEQEPAIVSCP